MNFYLVPTAQTAVGNQTFTDIEYLADVAGLNFNEMPFGVEPLALVILAAPNAALAAESDVYTFPTDLTTLLQVSDVATLGAYLSNLNLPNSFLTAGASFQSVVRQLAQIALVLQFAEGPQGTNGASVFNQITIPGQSGTPSAALAAIPAGVFDFTQANTSDSVADTIISVSAQFTAPIYVGQEGAI